MALPEDFVQELIMRSDISDLASEYVNLRRSGRNLVGLCPFHSEKTPSFNIYEENNSFYCFGCGVGGNVFNFVMRIENLDYIDSVKYLAQRAGMDMPEDSYDDSLSKLRKRIYEANREAARFYYRNLHHQNGKAALNYLKNRKIKNETIVHFGLGYSPNNRYALVNHLKKLGFKNNEIVAANLAFQNKNNNTVFDRFVNRVMFPIIDLRGNVIAFGGRILSDQKPKYLNTSDTIVFKKSNNLFYLNKAKNNKERTLILCEGYMDVIAIYQAGFKNAVATLGTAITSQQAMLIKRYADEVIICYDNDEAGQKATQKAISILRKTGVLIRVIEIPKGMDPDDFIISKGDSGPAAFKNVIDNSANDVNYRFKKLGTEFNLETPEGKVAYLTEATKILSTLENSIEQDIYTSKLAETVGVQKDSILNQIKKYSNRQRNIGKRQEFRKMQGKISGVNDKINQEKRKMPRVGRAEEAIIAYLLNNPSQMEYINLQLPESMFLTDFNRKLYSYFISRIKKSLKPLNNIAQDFTKEESSKIAEILSTYQTEAATPEALKEYINIIKEENLKPTKEDIESATGEELLKYIDTLKDKQK